MPMSTGTAIAAPPADWISSLSSMMACSLRAASTTVAPCDASSLAVAFPMPRLAPVMMVTLPSRSR